MPRAKATAPTKQMDSATVMRSPKMSDSATVTHSAMRMGSAILQELRSAPGLLTDSGQPEQAKALGSAPVRAAPPPAELHCASRSRSHEQPERPMPLPAASAPPPAGARAPA